MWKGKNFFRAAAVCLTCFLFVTAAGCGVEKTGGSVDGTGSAQADGFGDEASKTVYAMDTVMDLRAYGENAQQAVKDAETEIMRLDEMLSRGSEGSEIYNVNEGISSDVSDETAKLLDRALEICKDTGGAFDITVAPVMDLWGFYGQDYHVPVANEIRETLKSVDYTGVQLEGNTVLLRQNMRLDLGGIAKGYLSGRIMEIFQKDGVKSGIVSLGGNVQTLGTKTDGSKWNVAVQNPDLKNKDASFIGVIQTEDEAVVTSGSYQRYFEEDGVTYHHIIDPKTGYPANSGVVSVTIVSSDGTTADGLSTALFVKGLEGGSEYWRTHDGFEAVFVTEDGGIYVTDGLRDRFTSEYPFEWIKR